MEELSLGAAEDRSGRESAAAFEQQET